MSQRQRRSCFAFAFHTVGSHLLRRVSAVLCSEEGSVRLQDSPLTKDSASTFICGIAPLNFMSCFWIVRQFLTTSMRFFKL